MAGSVYSKNIRRTIWGSMGRYIAILAIIALGVGFFAGITNTKNAMMLTCDDYVSEYKMYDFKLQSTFGFEDADVDAVADVDEVAEAEGSVTADFFSEDRDGDTIVLRAHSITEKLNLLNLVEGRMPTSDDECVADDVFFDSGDIGAVVKVTDDNDKTSKKALKHKEYKIVGIVRSPYYIGKGDRGTTSLGDGSVDAFIYMMPGGLTSKYFTEIFATTKEEGYVFSDEYKDNIEAAEGPVTEAIEARGEERYKDTVADAEKSIKEGQQEVDDGLAELEATKESTYAQLASAKAELDANSSKIESGRSELASTKKELTSQRSQVSDGIKEIDKNLKKLEDAASSATGGTTTDGTTTGLPDDLSDLNLPDGVTLDSLPEGITGTSADADEDTAAAAAAAAEEYKQTKKELEDQRKELKADLKSIDAGLDQIDDEEKNLTASEKQLKQGYSDYYASAAQADAEFAAAEAELTEAQKEVDKARKELSKIDGPDIYVYDREDNQGFVSFESNSDIVDGIAKILPIFFLIIAALVCSTTMSRMIEEERPQIGALRALGYTTGRVTLKYMIYSGSAAVIGCVIGFIAGTILFPSAIWTAYGMMFGFAPIEYYFSWPIAVISLLGSLACSMGVTYISCRGQMSHMPAEIMRPPAPKPGKRIFLEKIGFLWSRMKFLYKVTARNIFRYKKRMIMMLLGIGGCTALILAGFGLNDSIAGIADAQYTEVEPYQITVVFSDTIDKDERSDFESEYGEGFDNTAILQESAVDVKGPKTTKSCTLMVTDDENMDDIVVFRENDEKLDYPSEGEAMLSSKLAEMLGVKDGDQVTINYDDTKAVDLTVSGIYKNYVSHYIYINDETYEEDFGKDYEPSIMFVTTDDDVDVSQKAEQINGCDDVAALTTVVDVKSSVDDMMKSLNYIILLIIGCAGALALIVLFNLGNINITEREREIATIEVLGFYPREMGSYVFRENFILAIMGIIVGIPAGYLLHMFIMSQIAVDTVAFNVVITPLSYLFTIVLVLVFTFIVDIILRRKLRRINMAEALKSTE